LVVINLAVEDDHVTLACRKHRLMPGGRQIDNRQPALRQRDAGLSIGPHAVIVRPAMPEQVGHPPRDEGILPCRASTSEKTGDSAHEGSSFARLGIEYAPLLPTGSPQSKRAPGGKTPAEGLKPAKIQRRDGRRIKS